MDAIAQAGIVGAANHVPPHLPAGSAVANMSLLGFDPDKYFTGRAPLEAAAQNIELGPHDWAVRCNLVTIEDQIMRDFTADHISDGEAVELLASLQAELDRSDLEFVAGVSYRNLLLYRASDDKAPFSRDTRSTPPHDLTDDTVMNDFPRGLGSDLLSELMNLSVRVFKDHPVNQRRIAEGKLPATNIWLWGLGKTPALPRFMDIYAKQGRMITAVDLLRGIGALLDWPRIEVTGATGYTDTDYAAKGTAAIKAIAEADVDLVCVHVEAPDEASHEGDVQAKIKAIEEIDLHIVGPIHEALKQQGDYRILVSPDHPTPVQSKTHSHGIVPFTIAGKGIKPDTNTSYDEIQAEASDHQFPLGFEVMKTFIDA
jgi:2,3-bisphosphoglycerate-independent phosphoglycerate mutase